jgi:23S rRNA (guanosine2251-2'-O)-methyltransferase
MRPHKFRRNQAVAFTATRNSGRDRDHVLCGFNAIQEALHVGTRQIETIWLAERKEGKRLRQVMALAAARGTPVEVVPPARLSEVAGTTAHQGIVAFVASTSLLTFDQLTARLTIQSPIPPIVVLDGVKDPRNLGAIIRSAAAFGIGGVMMPERRAVGITATVAKAAAGGLEHVAVAEVINISQSLERLKRLGFWIVGADEQAEDSCRTFAFPTPLALVLGGEEAGISPLVKRHCDALVSIPVHGQLRSLNVAVAAAVLFYEVVGRELRQHVASVEPIPETSSL